jgi:excisionase family DNA binding protein
MAAMRSAVKPFEVKFIMLKRESEKLLTGAQVAEMLSLKPVTIRQWIAKRKLASVKVGDRAIRIPESEVTRLIERGFVPALPERTR